MFVEWFRDLTSATKRLLHRREGNKKLIGVFLKNRIKSITKGNKMTVYPV